MLGKHVEEDSDPQGSWGGPLKTTFLLAMATPMIALPIERIFKPARTNYHGIADDRELDPRLAARIAQDLEPTKRFGEAPFFEPDVWTYLPSVEPFDVARDWPRRVLAPLRSPDAALGAVNAPVREILITLRNALAHGGVSYLDRYGGHSQFATNMVGFVSFARPPNPELRVLRVSVSGFESFLRLWARWLASSGVKDQLEQHGPGYFDLAAE